MHPFYSVLRQTNPVHTLEFSTFNIDFNITFPPMHRFFLVFRLQFFEHFSYPEYKPTYLSFLNLISYIILCRESLPSPTFYLPFGLTMALEMARPLTEMCTTNLPGSKGRPARKADKLTAICEPIIYKMWEPRRPTNLWVSTPCYRDSFSLIFYLRLSVHPTISTAFSLFCRTITVGLFFLM
jgi:hypothetical protein